MAPVVESGGRARAFRYRRSISWPCANLDLVPDNVPPLPFAFGHNYENYLYFGEGGWLLRRVKKRMMAHVAIPRVPAPPTRPTALGEFVIIASLSLDLVSSALSFLYPHELSRAEMSAKYLKAAAPAAWMEIYRRQNREAIDGGLADCVCPLAEGETARMRVIQREGSAFMGWGINLKSTVWNVDKFYHFHKGRHLSMPNTLSGAMVVRHFLLLENELSSYDLSRDIPERCKCVLPNASWRRLFPDRPLRFDASCWMRRWNRLMQRRQLCWKIALIR